MAENNSSAKRTGVIGGGIIAIIIAAIFSVEGGFVDNPKDPGGATNHGVTEKVARDHGYTGSMKDLPKEFAEGVYYKDYVLKPNFHLIVEASPAVAHKVIDEGVNAGPARAAKWFQQSLNALNRGGKDYANVPVDGQVGPKTVAAFRSLQMIRGEVKACELTLKLLDAQQASYYMSLTNLNTFMVGWVDNRIGNVPLNQCKDYGR